jgi:RHS repeat-associated protein
VTEGGADSKRVGMSQIEWRQRISPKDALGVFWGARRGDIRVKADHAVGMPRALLGAGRQPVPLERNGGSTQAVTAAFLPLPGGATAVYNASGLNRYRHSDWLGSSRLASTPGRAVYYDGAYSPMGESYAETGTTDRNFTGQNQDLATDLYDFMYREYHPAHGRWISPDPAGAAAADPANPQSWNRYSYVNGSPMNSADPLGLASITLTQLLGSEHDCRRGGPCRDFKLPVANMQMGVLNLSMYNIGFAEFWRPDQYYDSTQASAGASSGPNSEGTSDLNDCIPCFVYNEPPESGFTFGTGYAGNADIGIWVAGLEANATGVFTTSWNRRPSGGAAWSGAAVAYAGKHVAALPKQLTPPLVVGVYAGFGQTFVISNVGEVGQLKGPFLTFSGNVGLAVGGSVAVSVDSAGHWVGQITYGPGWGASFWAVTTNTACVGPGC